jgi:hypothetical protein
MDTKQPEAEPGARSDQTTNSADNSTLEFIDEFETVQPVRDIDPHADTVVIDAVGRPRLVRKPR